jgi:6-phosphogluconolactonase (cycloisomerase 2 family)
MADRTLLVGTGGERIYACSLKSNGQVQLLREIPSGNGPSWLLANGNLLYAANENSAGIQTYTIDDRQQGLLTLQETISSIGHTPCSFAVNPTGKWLAVSK